MFADQSFAPESTLMIVCDEKEIAYANYLIQLISQLETISAAIYKTKLYMDNLQQISSKQHIVFLGDSNAAKGQRELIPDKYNEFGMHYGWLGKRAVLYVDDTCIAKVLAADKKQQYKDFLEYSSKKYGLKHPDARKLSKLETATRATSAVLGAVALGSVVLPGVAAVAGTAVAAAAGQQALNAKVKAQQYQTLAKVFYQKGLKPFMEG